MAIAVAIIIFISNTTVLSFYAKQGKSKHHFLLVNSLAMSEILYSLYLSIIIIIHFVYEEQYALIANMWEDSLLCRVLAIMNITSFLTSKLTLLTMVVNILLITKYSMSRRPLSLKIIVTLIVICWLLGFAISTLWIYNTTTMSPLCIPVVETLEKPLEFFYTVCFFLVTSGIVCSVGILYCIVAHHIIHSGRDIQSNKKDNSTSLIVRAIALIFSHTSSLIGFIIIVYSPMIGNLNIIISSLIVFLMPLNSLTDPVIFTFYTKDFLTHIKGRSA